MNNYQRYVIVQQGDAYQFFYNAKTFRWTKGIDNASFHSLEAAKKQVDFWKEHRIADLCDAVVMKVECHDL
jgi:hypothetical protein